MSNARRFEIRCTPEVRELVDAVLAAEGDITYSQFFRRLVLGRARGMESPNARVRRALAKVEEG